MAAVLLLVGPGVALEEGELGAQQTDSSAPAASATSTSGAPTALARTRIRRPSSVTAGRSRLASESPSLLRSRLDLAGCLFDHALLRRDQDAARGPVDDELLAPIDAEQLAAEDRRPSVCPARPGIRRDSPLAAWRLRPRAR